MKIRFAYFIPAVAAITLASCGSSKKQAAPIVEEIVVIDTIPTFKLHNDLDSLSYAIGILDAGFFKQQGIDSLNYDALLEAVSATLEGKEALMTPDMANQTLRDQLQKAAMKKIQPAIDQGDSLMAANKLRPEITTTASGIQYEVMRPGTGAKPSSANAKVKVHYRGTLINGEEFDASYKRGEPAEFGLNQVIKGWTEGVQLMEVGSKYKFYIPYTLAYGANGQPPVIPGGATLIFEIELLDIISQ